MPKEVPSITSTLASLASLSSSSSPAPLRIHFPATNTTVSTPGVQLTKEAAAPTPIYSVSASALSHLTFPNCDLSPTTSASTESSLATSAGQSQAAAAAAQGLAPGQVETSANRRRGSGISLRPDPNRLDGQPRYMVVALDLDAPFPSVPLMSPLLHGVQADLCLSTEDIEEGEEYIPLEAVSSGIAEESHDQGQVVDYMGPSPPPTSSPHRYVFMLWEQPRGLTGERICEEVSLSYGYGHGDHMGLMGRARWDQEGFEKRLGLERVVGGNYFAC